ncbi:MAG: sigma-54 dependent transcriptional regulator, partial [Rhodocyclaceae bacterium]|nr:sigma-54 dependent transcriptional regulator [Rhodocyclaceae bacterium]
LIASELFGHERGSFTGATRDHRGYFERASGGTLFLDEITEMPPDLQSSLLRVLETGRVLRVGGSEEIAVDVRIVAATNRPAQEAVRCGRLREDLYYRLQAFPIRMPPLRERGDEIIALARHFLARARIDHGADKQLSPAAEQALLAYPWPGNVRELKNAIERAALLAESSIGPADLGLDAPAPGLLPAAAGGGNRVAARPVTSSLREVEKRLILGTLSACGGNKRQAAQRLGVSLKTLYNKLKRYAGNDDDQGGRREPSP